MFTRFQSATIVSLFALCLLPASALGQIILISADYMVVEAILSEIGEEVPRLEKVLSLKLLTKLTDDQIAAVLGVSEATAKRYYTVAKAKFREKLKNRMTR